jgi:hypothetical protein
MNKLGLLASVILSLGSFYYYQNGGHFLAMLHFIASAIVWGSSYRGNARKLIFSSIVFILLGTSLLRSEMSNDFLAIPMLAGFVCIAGQGTSRLPNGFKRILLILSSILIISPAIKYCFNSSIYAVQEPKRAILKNGKWAYVESNNDSLSIKTQYSYGLLSDILGADLIEDSSIEDYDELWVITPTSPFDTVQTDRILKWLSSGKKLVLIADHTDLFGHAGVLNSLTRHLGLLINKDAIIGIRGGGGKYIDFLNSYNGLTASSLSGRTIPFMHIFGYDDGIDYSNNSFFNDFRITSEDDLSLYTCGVVGTYGKGVFTVFSDSTLFSNFGISRPSSQAILKLLVGITLPSLFVILLNVTATLVLGYAVTNSKRYTCVFLLALLLLQYLVLQGKVEGHLYWPDRAIEASGNWDIAEFGDGYATPLASAFFAAKGFPKWTGRSSGQSVEIDGRLLNPANASPLFLGNDQDLMACLESKLEFSTELSLGLAETITLEEINYGSFWFNNGVGPLRENLFKRFWGAASELSISPEITIFSCKYHLKDSLGVFEISGRNLIDDWYILGNGIVAKKIENDGFLIRKQWQVYHMHSDNIILRFAEMVDSEAQ